MRPYRCNALALSGADHQLKKDLPLEEIERIIAEDNPWVRFVPNEREASMEQLTPRGCFRFSGDSGRPRA